MTNDEQHNGFLTWVPSSPEDRSLALPLTSSNRKARNCKASTHKGKLHLCVCVYMRVRILVCKRKKLSVYVCMRAYLCKLVRDTIVRTCAC